MKAENDLKNAVTEKVKLRNAAGVGNEKNQSSRNEENTRNDSYDKINQKNKEMDKKIVKIRIDKLKVEISYDEVS